MKPYGRRNPLRHKDYFNVKCPKGHVNWWEVEMDDVCKKRSRQEWKKELRGFGA